MDICKTSAGLQASQKISKKSAPHSRLVLEAQFSQVSREDARSKMPKSGTTPPKKRARTNDCSHSSAATGIETSLGILRRPPSTNTVSNEDSLPPDSQDDLHEDDELSTSREPPYSDTLDNVTATACTARPPSNVHETKQPCQEHCGPTPLREASIKRSHPGELEDSEDKHIVSDRRSGIRVAGQPMNLSRHHVDASAIAKTPKTRGASQKPAGQKKAKAGQLVFICVRSLVRLGILPAISAVDETFLSTLRAVVANHDRTSPRIVGCKTNDPYFLLRREDTSIPATFSELTHCYVGRLRKSLDICPAMLQYIRVPMSKMASKLLGPDSSIHMFTLASSFDALERLRGNEVRLLLFNSWTPDERSYPDVASWNLRNRCIMGIKLLCIIYAGLLAIYRQSWNNCTSLQPSYQRLLPNLYHKAQALRLGWNTDCIRALMFEPCSLLHTETCASLDISHIGSHYERLCTVYLTAVMNVSKSEQNALQSNNRDMEVSVTHIGAPPASQALTETSNDEGKAPIDESGPAGFKAGSSLENVPAPWNVNVYWSSSKEPMSSVVNGQYKAVAAYEKDMSRMNTYKTLLMKCKKHRVPICDTSDAKDTTAVDDVIAKMRELAGCNDHIDMDEVYSKNIHREPRASNKGIDEAECGQKSLVQQWLEEDNELAESLQQEREN